MNGNENDSPPILAGSQRLVWFGLISSMGLVIFFSNSEVKVEGLGVIFWACLVILISTSRKYVRSRYRRWFEAIEKSHMLLVALFLAWGGSMVVIGNLVPHGRLHNVIVGLGAPLLAFAVLAAAHFAKERIWPDKKSFF